MMTNLILLASLLMTAIDGSQAFPKVSEEAVTGYFPLVTAKNVTTICTDEHDYPVVGIAAQMLADDIERVTGQHPAIGHGQPKNTAIVAGTLGKSQMIDGLVKSLKIDVSGIRGKWESFIIKTAKHPKTRAPLLLIIGSDRRGTAFGLT
ncbi:MAG: hypothetical protein IJ569_06085, partial [Prevotella sp.]|nr:hypothetical protein [Prevotella sp.]